MLESARKKLTHNLPRTTKHRPSIPEMKKDVHEIMCRITLKRYIVGRLLGLYDEEKGKLTEQRRFLRSC